MTDCKITGGDFEFANIKVHVVARCCPCGNAISYDALSDICGECAEAESRDRHAAHKNGECAADCFWCAARRGGT